MDGRLPLSSRSLRSTSLAAFLPRQTAHSLNPPKCPDEFASSIRRVIVADNNLIFPANLRKCGRRTTLPLGLLACDYDRSCTHASDK